MRPLLLAVLLLTAACHDPADPETTPVGELTATLSGAVSERYVSSGPYPGPTTDPATFAAAQSGNDDGTYIIGGFRARGSGLQDAITIGLRSVDGPGSYPTESLIVSFGQSERTTGSYFTGTSGEVTLDVITVERLEGSFQGTALELLPPLSGRHPDTVHISEGRFSVPIID